MKQKSTSAAVAAIAASLMASLAPVPAKSTMLPATAAESRTHQGVATALTFELSSGQIFLPLDEATDYLNQINQHQQFLLSAMIQDRQNRGKGAMFSNPAQIKRICAESLEQHLRVKEAIRIVITPDNLAKLYPDSLEMRAQYRATLIRFGRAVAQGEFVIRDTIATIEQSRAPTNVVYLSDMPSEEDAKAMIAAEHKNLGLSAPEFC